MTKEVKIRGVVTPVEWDDDGVIRVSIATDDEEEYFFDDEDTEEEFLDIIQREVEVKGYVGVNEDGEHIIDVTRYRVLGD